MNKERVFEVANSKNVRWAIEQLPSLTDDELAMAKVEVDNVIGAIRSQVDASKSRAAAGEYDDQEWFRAAESAARAKGRVSQAIQAEMGIRNRRRKEANRERDNTFDARFVVAARIVLSPEQYAEVVTVANAIPQKAEGVAS